MLNVAFEPWITVGPILQGVVSSYRFHLSGLRLKLAGVFTHPWACIYQTFKSHTKNSFKSQLGNRGIAITANDDKCNLAKLNIIIVLLTHMIIVCK